MRAPLRAAIPAIALSAVAAAVAIPALTSEAQDSGRDITVREKVGAVNIDDVKPLSRRDRFSPGDRVTTHQKLFDQANRRIGTLYTDCVNVGPTAQLFKATLQCAATYRFRDGQVEAAGTVQLAPGERLAIVGGTGAYGSATGEVEFAPPVKGYDTVDVLHLDR